MYIREGPEMRNACGSSDMAPYSHMLGFAVLTMILAVLERKEKKINKGERKGKEKENEVEEKKKKPRCDSQLDKGKQNSEKN